MSEKWIKGNFLFLSAHLASGTLLQKHLDTIHNTQVLQTERLCANIFKFGRKNSQLEFVTALKHLHHISVLQVTNNLIINTNNLEKREREREERERERKERRKGGKEKGREDTILNCNDTQLTKCLLEYDNISPCTQM